MARDTIKRNQIADYLNTGTGDAETWSLCGTGYNTLDENPNAQTDTKTYINDSAASSTIKGYQPQFPFDTDLIKSEPAVMALYNIGRNELTGSDAEMDYLRVDLFDPVVSKDGTFKARKFRVAVEVSSCAGAGGEAIKVTGNLNNIGTFVAGTFDVKAKKFTADADATPVA